MNRHRFVLGAVLLACLAGGAAARWSHYAPAQAPVSQPLTLEFLDPEGREAPAEALLFAELDGRALPSLSATTLAAGRVVFTVPPEQLSGRELAYRAEMRFPEGVERAPETGLWRLALAPREELALVELLSDPEAAPGEEALIAFAARGDQADLSGARLLIDGRPVEGVEADPWLVTWRGTLPEGVHQVELRLKDRQGRDLQPQRLLFTARGVEQVPMGFTAGAWQEFNMDYQDARTAQWQRYHAGQMRFHAWRGRAEQAWNLKGRILLNTLDLEREELQPQSRLNLELERGSFLLGLGDRQPEFGAAVLSGTRVRGLELNADFKDFGLRLVGGRAKAARDPILGAASGDVDFAGTYARDLYALDLRMGRRYGLVEGGLTVLKARDDEASLDLDLPAGWDPADSLTGVRPQDNAVMAARLDLNAFRGRFSGRNQAAFSLYNSNITGGPWDKDDLETFGAGDLPDPSSFEDIIVVNQYFSPLDLAKGELMPATAITSNWQLAVGPNETTLDFRRVGGAYRSLGNSFLTPDQREWRLSDRVRLWQNQIYVDLGLGQTTDNLEGQYDESVGTTARDLFNLGLAWYPRGRDLQVRLGFERQAEANEALDLLDPLADAEARRAAEARQIDGSLGLVRLGVSGSLDWLARRHQWSLSLVNQGYDDAVGRVPTADGTAVARADRSTASGQFGLGWQTTVGRGLALDAGLSVYGSDSDDPTIADYSTWSLRGALGRSWLNQRLRGTVRAQFQDVTSETHNQQDSFTRTDLGASAEWRWREGMALTGALDWQAWAGDREDSYLRVVMRLSQEF